MYKVLEVVSFEELEEMFLPKNDPERNVIQKSLHIEQDGYIYKILITRNKIEE